MFKYPFKWILIYFHCGILWSHLWDTVTVIMRECFGGDIIWIEIWNVLLTRYVTLTICVSPLYTSVSSTQTGREKLRAVAHDDRGTSSVNHEIYTENSLLSRNYASFLFIIYARKYKVICPSVQSVQSVSSYVIDLFRLCI